MKPYFILLFWMIFIISLVAEDYPINLPFSNLRLFENETNDSRCESLGKCSLLSSTTSNYLFSNPSMLSRFSNKNIRLTVTAKSSKETQKSHSNSWTNNSKIRLKLNSFSIGIPLKFLNDVTRKTSLGIGYRNNFDYDGYNQYKGHLDERHKIKTKGGFDNLVIGLGRTYNDKFFWGGSASFSFLSKYYEKSEIYNWETEGTLKGTFYTLSASYKFNDGDIFAVKFLPKYSIEMKSDKNTDKIIINIPDELSLGCRLILSPKVTAFWEYVTKKFSELQFKRIHSFKPFKNTDNGFSLRFGGEYKSLFILRSGFFIESVPIFETGYAIWKDAQYYSFSGKPMTELGLTFGGSFDIFYNFTFDYSCIYSWINDEGNFFDNNTETYFDEISVTKFKLNCTFGYEFDR